MSGARAEGCTWGVGPGQLLGTTDRAAMVKLWVLGAMSF